MTDYRQRFLSEVEQSLTTILDADARAQVMRKVLHILSEYEITERSTELAVYDDQNERLLKKYCACMYVDGKSEKTVYAYRRSLSRFFGSINIPVTEVDTYGIRYYLACEKERGLSDVSVENTRANLSAFFQWLTVEEIIPKNPCARIKPIRYKDEVKHPFSEVELDKLRSACMTLKERALLEMLLSSGVRVSELSQMDVADIDFEHLTVHVKHGKGNKERITYINEIALSHLRKYILSKDAGKALFCNKNGERLEAGGVRFILNGIGKRAGVENVHPHRFRRTFATRLASRGMSIQEVQRLLGHSDISTTMRYVSVNDEQVRNSYRQHIA